MSGYLLLIPLAIVVGFIAWLQLRRPRQKLPFTRRGPLLTAGELRFYRTLASTAPPDLMVFVKVRLLDVVAVPAAAWQQFGAPASGMHLDFVLAEAATLSVRLVIELDDKSHQREDVRQRDGFKDAALASAGIPLLRVRVARRYNAAELRSLIEAKSRA